MTIFSTLILASLASTGFTADVLHDEKRQRDIPVEVSLPLQSNTCTIENKCNVAFISPGSGLEPSDYRFIASHLNALGYLTVGIQSVLPGDPPDGQTGNIIADRTPGWQKGVDDLLFAQQVLGNEYPQYNWQALTLIGHSNGGDLSALALAQHPGFAKTIITLDSRRYPLPREGAIRLLSLRGSDFPADPGVLPDQTSTSQSCIVTIANSRHNDMNDRGPDWLKSAINNYITAFIKEGRCGA
jgi:pimeloyl-ACP methyl ester carboxylesterase